MYKKLITKILANRLSKIVFLLMLILYTPVKIRADDIKILDKTQPNQSLGIADINTGLEAGHLHPNGKYQDWFQANYSQADNLGIQWNRWEVSWPKVELNANINKPPDFSDYKWSCVWDGKGSVPEACPNNGDRYDYLRLTQEDKARGIHSVVLITGVPSAYQDHSGNYKIYGLSNDIFITNDGTTTDDPYDPNINIINPINVNNRWANLFYYTTIQLGALGVNHWQIMNELNDNEYWADGGWFDYIRVLQVSSKILQYRQIYGQALEDQIILGGLIYTTSNNAQEWVKDMFEELAITLSQTNHSFDVDALALHTYDRNKTTYDYPIEIYDLLAELDNQYGLDLSTKPLWLTETGSNSCHDEYIFEVCPPVNGGAARSTDKEQSFVTIQV